MKTYTLAAFAKKVGVCTKTLQRWDNKGLLPAKRTPTGRRFWTDEDYEKFINGMNEEG